MQAKKVLDGSKHEYSTDMGWAHRTLQYMYIQYTPQGIVRRGQHHCTICTSDSVPSAPVPRAGARWWSWSRCLESTGRAGLLGWAGRAVCTGSRSHHGRAEKKPKCKPLGGEQQQRPAESSALSQMLYAVLATRRPSSTHQSSTPATHSIVSVNCWTTSTTTPATPSPPPRPCSCGAETLGARSCPAPARGAALVTETGSGAVSDW